MSQYSDQKTAELKKALNEKRESLQEFRFQVAGARGSDVKEARNTRRDIARILTELRARELNEDNKGA